MVEMNDAKAYLQQVEKYDKMINSKQADLEFLRSLVTKVTPTLKEDVVSTSGSNSKFEDVMAKIIDLEAEINNLTDLFIDHKEKVKNNICKLQVQRQQEILHMKYLNYQNFNVIASELNMTVRGCRKAHDKALESLKKVLNYTTYSANP